MSDPRPTRPPRSETREVVELRSIREAHPELSAAVDMHIELLELHRRVQGRVPLPWFELSEEIIRIWQPYAQHQDKNWQAHRDINDVMLATALIPDLFLSIGERLSLTQ